jgi:hypothetical protein
MGVVVRESLQPYGWLAPLFHVATIVFVILLWRFNKKVSKYFYAYLAASYVFMALAQNITFTEEFGLVVIFSNLLQILLVGILWAQAVFAAQNDLSPAKLERWRFWALPLAVLAFWAPMNEIGEPDLSPMLLLTSAYGLAFCFTTPVIVFILTLHHPNVYKPAYRFLCMVGAYLGVLNMGGPLMIPGYPLWVAFLHIPLLSVSVYGLVLERIKVTKQAQSLGVGADPEGVPE